MDTSYFLSQFDNPSYSDFKLVCRDKVLHLHKLILVQIEYFKTFFESGVNSDKSKMEIEQEHYDSAIRLIKYIYGENANGYLIIENPIQINKLMDLIILTDMWQFPKKIREQLFNFIQKTIIKNNVINPPYTLAYIDILIKIFGNDTTTCSNASYCFSNYNSKCTRCNKLVDDKKQLCIKSCPCLVSNTPKIHQGGKEFVNVLINAIGIDYCDSTKYYKNKSNEDIININLDNYYIFNLLDINQQANYYAIYGKHTKLHELFNGDIAKICQCLNHNWFNQSDILNKEIIELKIMHGKIFRSKPFSFKDKDNLLYIQSFIPFKGHYLEVIGQIIKQEKDVIQIQLNKNTNISQSLCINNEPFQIDELYFQYGDLKINIKEVLLHVFTGPYYVKLKNVHDKKIEGSVCLCKEFE